MATYAADTAVSSEQSRAEIERTLRRYGADAFAYGYDGAAATIGFRMRGRFVKFQLTMPARQSEEFTTYMRGSFKYRREDHVAEQKWEQACRQRWRALALVIKAKLEAVECEITTLEDEFLAHMVVSDGRTVGEILRPQLDEHYKLGGKPHLRLAFMEEEGV